MPQLTAEVIESNRMKAGDEKIQFASGTNPIKHVIYIIKENRTYDQVFADLAGGDGDPRLQFFTGDHLTAVVADQTDVDRSART